MDTPEACGRVFSIGSDEPNSILDLAKRVIELTDNESTIEHQSYTDAYDKDFEDIRRRVTDLTQLYTSQFSPGVPTI